MEAFFTKLPNASFIPASEDDAELLSKVKVGETVKLTLVRPRNIKFHRKFFALMHLAFDYWETPKHGEGSAWAEKIPIERNFDRFRYDITILAGYYDATYRLNGDVRLEAKSISFGSMSEDDFEKLYSKVIDVIIARVCTQYTEYELRKQVEDLVLDFV
jgi:hypothetical protein